MRYLVFPISVSVLGLFMLVSGLFVLASTDWMPIKEWVATPLSVRWFPEYYIFLVTAGAVWFIARTKLIKRRFG